MSGLPSIGGLEPGDERNGVGHAGAAPVSPLPLADPVSEIVFAKAQEKLLACMDATRPVWSKEAKEFKFEPDWPTIIAAVKIAFEYRIGRPVERRLEIRANAETWDAQKARQLQTPEGIRFLLAAGAISAQEAEEAFERMGNTPEPSQ